MLNATYAEKLLSQKPYGWTMRDPAEVHTFSFEELDLFWWHDFVESHWKWAIYAGAIYVMVIFGLERWMRDKPAMSLRMPLFWWNFVLSIFSFMGFARMLPSFLEAIWQPQGVYATICWKNGLEMPTAFWGIMFSLSKFWELGDTVFIVLRKRPLIFLQWYHHLVTMSVVWILVPLVEPIIRWYGVLNYGVHSLMYPYFAAKALGIKVPARLSSLITTLQFAQMLIGFSVNMASLYFQSIDPSCVRYPISIKLFAVVYGSFLVLFGRLFYQSVIKSVRSKKGKSE